MIRGAGGSSKSSQRAPVIAPDSLHSVAYARVLDLVGEGPIVGFADQANPLSCVFFSETPLANADGSLNFKNVQVDSRVGTQDQEYIKGFPSVESEIAVGVQLRADTSWTQALTNPNLSAVRVRISTPGMSNTNTENGDVTGTSVSYAIDVATDGGPFVQAFAGALTGKTQSKYERSHRVDLPSATSGWVVRVRRLTADSTSQYLQNSTWIDSYTEIVDAKLRYPNSALVAAQIDASQFQAVPSRAYRLRGRIIQVPSNYDPDARTYSGVWDGTFQPRYSNNPAWVFYDLVTHARYGLGQFLPPALVNKWALYAIGVYCDEMVPDGAGGMEPRFTCNLFLQTRQDAYKVLQDVATIFRGMAYWSAGAVHAVADMPGDPVYTYTAANVIGGRFNYAGSARRARHTVALVTWNDLADFGRQRVEYVDDPGGIARYGIQSTDVLAIGCASRGQARRAGKWLLATERFETDTVSFALGLDGVLAAPGQIVRIADETRAGKRIGGRIAAATTTIITLDKAPEGVVAGDTLTVILPGGTAQTRTIASLVGRDVTVTAAFDAAPVRDAVWVVESSTLAAQRFRVLSAAQAEDGTFSITAVQHEPDKYDYVDYDDPIEPLPTRGDILPAPVAAVTVTQFVRLGPEGGYTVLAADWEPAARAVAYDIQWRKDAGAWSPIVRTRESQFELENAYVGEYVFRVWSVNPQGFVSAHTTSAPITALPPVLPTKVLTIVDGAIVIDCRYTNFFLHLTSNVTSVTFENVSESDTILIELQQGGEGNTIDFGPSVVPISGVPYVPTATPGAVDVLGLATTNGGVIWRLAVQKPVTGDPGDPGGGIFVVTVAPSPASSSVTTDGATPSQPSVQVTATPANGTAPYTYSWTRADSGSGSSFDISDATVANPTFSVPSGTTAFPSTKQSWRVVVADAAAQQAQAAVEVTLARTRDEVVNTWGGEVFSANGIGLTGPSGARITTTFRPDGTWDAFSATTIDGITSPAVSVGAGDWHGAPAPGVGTTYEIRITPTLSAGITADLVGMNPPPASWGPLTGAKYVFIEQLTSSAGSESSTYSVLIEIRPTAAPSNVTSGTLTVTVEGENS